MQPCLTLVSAENQFFLQELDYQLHEYQTLGFQKLSDESAKNRPYFESPIVYACAHDSPTFVEKNVYQKRLKVSRA